jgi:hypothetical protein
MTTLTEFPDLSHFRPGISLSGVLALLTKATQGTSNTDPTYVHYKTDALHRGIPFGGYHYVTTADAKAQAKHAFAVIGAEVPCMWDVEKGSGSIAHMYAVHDAYTDLGGTATLGYVPRWYWEQLGRPSLTGMKSRGLALVSSDYTPGSATGSGRRPYGGMTPAIVQFTDKHLLHGQSVDFNAFPGDVEQLRALMMGDLMALSAADWTKLSHLIDQRILAALPQIEKAIWHSDQLADPSGQSNAVTAANALEVTRNAVLAPPPAPPVTPSLELSPPGQRAGE